MPGERDGRASCSGRLREGGPRREDGQRGHRAAPEADSVRWVESRPPPDLPGDVLSLLDHHLLDLGTYGDPNAVDLIQPFVGGVLVNVNLATVPSVYEARRSWVSNGGGDSGEAFEPGRRLQSWALSRLRE